MMPSNDASIGETSLRHPGAAAESVAPENAKNALPRCQACRSVAIRRSHRTGFREKALSLTGIYPYHCHACKARSFLRVVAVASTNAQVTEKRRERAEADAKRNQRLALLFVVSLALFLLLAKFLILKPPPMTEGE
jgi:hypothetical protein